MKKFFALLLTVLALALCLTGCKENVNPVANVGGEVKAGNGSFAVEKGDYVYFINGISADYANNQMGEVSKGALCRVKTQDIGKVGATVETVIPKLMSTSSATNGVFIYGNTVYYACPYDQEDKAGTVRSDYTDFRTFNLENADSKSIGFEKNVVSKYQFIQSNGNVYLAYEYTVGSDKKFRVLNMNGEEVYSVDKYSALLFADNNSNKIYFAKLAYSESLKADESFHEVYSYTVGSNSAEMVLSGCGKNGITRDGRDGADYSAKILTNYTDFMGATITLIKNTGNVLVMRVSGVDTTLATSYYLGFNIADGVSVSTLKEMSVANSYSDTAIVATSYYKSLTEIYYVENSTYVKGLVKYNYTNKDDAFNGRTLISNDAAGYNIATVDGDYMYLCGSSGDYYRINLNVAGAELKKINAVRAKSLTEWFVPRIVGNKFICVYSDGMYQNHLYAIDMTGIDGAEDEDGKTEYEKVLEDYAELDRANVLAIKNTLVSKMSEDENTAFTTALDATYPEEK